MQIGIVGCGYNSDYHINFANEYPGLEIVGIVDKNENSARECAVKHGIENIFSSINDLVNSQTPDVIHIVTPPQTHFSLVKEAIQAKCHVLVEKPMTLSFQEANELFTLAEKNGIKLCAMHNHFYDPCMIKAKQLADSGQTGKIVYVESYYGLNTQIPQIMSYPDINKLSWVFDLPGGLFHDFLAHPLYLLLEYTGRPIRIEASTRSNGTLFQNLPDELHILIEGEKAMGKLTLSFTARPFGHFLNLYGTKMFINVDFNNMATKTFSISKLPNAATKLTFNLSQAGQLTKQTIANLFNFITGKLKPYQGMKTLIHRFYDSILQSKEIPVSKEQALSVIKVMDTVWEQIGDVNPTFENVPGVAVQKESAKGRVLVTGAGGFLGKRLTEVLVERGYDVRVLLRKLSRIDHFRELGVEINYGDVRDEETLEKAISGMDYIIHAAAAQEGDWDTFEQTTIKGTASVFRLARLLNIKRVIYISSMSVYQVNGLRPGSIISENSEFDKAPQARGFYTASKIAAEGIAQECIHAKDAVPTVILRPATIYGPGGPVMTPLIGVSVFDKLFVILGKKGMELPFVYIDNLVDAIILSLEHKNAVRESFNVIDDVKITKQDYIQRFAKKLFSGSFGLFLPYWFVYSTVIVQEVAFKMLNKEPVLTKYRLNSASTEVTFSNNKIKHKLNWTPNISIIDGLQKTFNWYKDHA